MHSSVAVREDTLPIAPSDSPRGESPGVDKEKFEPFLPEDPSPSKVKRKGAHHALAYVRTHAIKITFVVCVIAVIAAFTAVTVHWVNGGFRTLGDAVDDVLTIGTDVTHTAESIMGNVGKEVESTYTALGKDYSKVKEPVLAFTDMVAEHSAGLIGGAMNITSDVGGVAKAGEQTLEDGADFLAWQLRYAAWYISCAFKTAEQCKSDFYEKFHLCGHADRTAKVDGRLVTVHEPCKDANWKVEWDRSAVLWEKEKTNGRFEHCKMVARSAAFMEELQFCIHVTNLRFHMGLTFGKYRNCGTSKTICAQVYCLDEEGNVLDGDAFTKCILKAAHRTSKLRMYDARLDLSTVIDGRDDDRDARELFEAVEKAYLAASNGRDPKEVKYPKKIDFLGTKPK